MGVLGAGFVHADECLPQRYAFFFGKPSISDAGLIGIEGEFDSDDDARAWGSGEEFEPGFEGLW